jgi:hypothetical protein
MEAALRKVIVRFSSPPIELAASQIGMFNFVALMGYGEKPRRQLKQLAEFIYDHKHRQGSNKCCLG